MSIRAPAVADLFYPSDPDALRCEIESLLSHARAPVGPPPKALVVPHAGLMYSGAVAATAYRRLETLRAQIERVVLLGPAHRVWIDGMALAAAEGFATPLGTVPTDPTAWARVNDLSEVACSDEPHRAEHCLEVQLPFLQLLLDRFSLVPVVVGRCRPERVAELLDRLWGGQETLVVISSDLSHFHDYAAATALDRATSRRIVEKATDLVGEEACGAAAINGLMASYGCRRLDVQVVDLRNSGDTAGDRDRVVGYGAYVLASS